MSTRKGRTFNFDGNYETNAIFIGNKYFANML